MLLPRIIPCLLVRDHGLVKTVNFQDYKYVGDPINAVKIFNEKKADELIVLDIDATSEGRGPDYQMIKNIAVECRMPLCYGGGIRDVDQALKIFALGVEKIALSSIVFENPKIVQDLSNEVGSQSVAVVLDIKKRRFGNKYDIYTHNASKATSEEPVSFSKKLVSLGAGEIIINSIDRDGKMCGYDEDIIREISKVIDVPMTVLGGAGSLIDFEPIFQMNSLIGVAAGSIFVFKGKYKAVLINYPTADEKVQLYKRNFNFEVL